MSSTVWIRWFEELSHQDIELSGGKNAALGELIGQLHKEGVRVPSGFALTTSAYRQMLTANHLVEPIRRSLAEYHAGRSTLRSAGSKIRRRIEAAPLPQDVEREILAAYAELGRRLGEKEPDVAVRSSATAEDLPDASFAGQQETYLNIWGGAALLHAVRAAMASLFTDRAITYREMNGIDHMKTAISVGVQKMVRADLAGAGVLFTLDTESGCPNVILINASWGLGEYVVKGLVNPDQYLVFKGLADETDRLPIIDKILGNKDRKLIYASEEASGAPSANANALPSAAGTTRSVDTRESERRAFVLSDQEIEQLARWAVAIERRFGVPMDIEWAKDGLSGALYILQARPETVHAREVRGMLRSYSIPAKGEPLLTGVSVGNSIAAGPVALVTDATELDLVQPGSILVARMTDPDWVPAMRRAAGVVTETGGRTCHAAIVSREIGIPAVIGAERATELLGPGDPVTVSCAEGEKGFVYAGLLDIHTTEIDLSTLPATKTRVMLNLASPESAMRWWQLPSDGVGLARMEFIISEWIRIHPMALVRFKELDDSGQKEQISAITAGYDDKTEYFVEKLAAGIARLAAPYYPKVVILRTSDFKTNEYANLIAGRAFEPEEENPMIGWRGASRYYSPEYREAFALECRAIRRVREEKGLENLAVMIPFCRTVEEADRVLTEMEKHGLRRGAKGLRIFMMCEIPSNVVLADQFARRFDGFSIGSNDLTQLVLGIDRDSSRLSYLFDERNEAVRSMIRDVIRRAHVASATVGICGEAPSNYPEFVDFLVAAGIDSMSVEPDSFAVVKQRIAVAEERGVESAAEHLLETPRVSTLVDEFGRIMPGDTP